ncbi:MAG: glycosyltransferase family 2 protein [Proteobacteria bacterium]|nr:glycosyltransferase family 2 protein [Pseudomonadota bacterium]
MSASAVVVVERIENLCVIGWAADRASAKPLPVTLRIDNTEVATVVYREPRVDVATSLGAPVANFGYRLALPPEVWQAGGQSLRTLVVVAGDQMQAVFDPRPLWSHVQAIVALPFSPARVQAAQLGLIHHAATRPAWPPEHFAALRQAARQVQAHIELCHQGMCQGKVLVDGAAQGALSLHAPDGSDLGAAVLYLPRSDGQALGVEPFDQGFVIDIPPTVWRWADAQGDVCLQLHAEGEAVDDALVHWRPTDVLIDLVALHAAGMDSPGAQRTLLHLLSHVEAAKLWPQLHGTLRQWLSDQAALFGLADWLAASAYPPPLRDERDPLSQALHDRLRALNAAWLSDDADACVAVADAALAATKPGSALRHELVLAILPQMCAIDRYAALRPWLDASRLRELATTSDNWALSLVLPEAAASADYILATAVTRRLHTASGWLNTECVAAAVRTLATQWPDTPEARTQATEWLLALVTLLRTYGADFWGRGPDSHLIAAQVTLLRLADRLPADQAEHLTATALQAHGLTPEFWAAMQRQWPQSTTWPMALRAAHTTWLRAVARWCSGDDAQALITLAELTPLATWPAAATWARMALSRSAGALDAEALVAVGNQAAFWGTTEALRLAAHPAPLDAAATLDAPLSGLRAHIQAVADVAPARDAGLVTLWLRALSDLTPVPEASTLRTLAVHDGGCSAALAAWLATVWSGTATGNAAPALAHARELWHTAWAANVDETTAHPPQPLVAAALAAQHLAPLQSLATAWTAMLASQAPALWAAVQPPAQPRLTVTNPLYATLVVVISQHSRLDATLARIRATWGPHLNARGLSWLVAVGEGNGSMQDGVLALAASDAPEHRPHKALALLDWVLAHTQASHLLCLDDVSDLAVDAWLDTQPHLTHHYHGRAVRLTVGELDRRGHQREAISEVARHSLDTSPEPSVYADGRTGWCLSRWAMAAVQRLRATPAGAQLTRGAYLADKLIGDLAAAAGLVLSNQGLAVAVRSCPGAQAAAVNTGAPTFDPGAFSPTLICHRESNPVARAPGLSPRYLWPCDAPPVLNAFAPANALELLSPAARAHTWANSAPMVVAVMRNERLMLPHFLAHYRAQGVRHFVLVDNLSDDGTRELALAQEDVLLYSAATPYRDAHYGVAWQQAVLAAHGHGRWSVLVDLDELLIYPDCETRPLAAWLATADAEGADAVRTVMIDMYPEGDLADADLARQAPFEAAPWHDRQPLLDWHLGSGRFSNGRTQLSALRHRLAPGAAPNFFTAQKIALLRHQPWMRLSDGLHDVAGVTPARGGACLAHFKYHADFARKVHEEVRRRQHFNDAEEYRRYQAMLAEAQPRLFDAAHAVRYHGSAGWAAWMTAGDNDD